MHTTRMLVAAATLAGASLAMSAPAGAHVHGFTPLGCLTVDDANSGAAVGFVRAADAAAPMDAEDSPLIPVNQSGQDLTGGQGAANACG